MYTEQDFEKGMEKLADVCYEHKADMLKIDSVLISKTDMEKLGWDRDKVIKDKIKNLRGMFTPKKGQREPEVKRPTLLHPFVKKAAGEEAMPQPGFMTKHPVATTAMGGAAGAVGGGLLGGAGGAAIGAMGGPANSTAVGASAGATLGAIIGAALGARTAENQEEDYSAQLLNYLSKASALKTAGKAGEKKETAEDVVGRYGKGIGKMMGNTVGGMTLGVRGLSYIPRKILLPKEMKELRGWGGGAKESGGNIGESAGRGLVRGIRNLTAKSE